MSKFKKFITSPRIQIALATGISIIAIAYFSKRVLPEPIGYLPAAIPPFLMAIHEAVRSRYKNRKICTTWYWILAILIATAIIILAHAFRQMSFLQRI